MSLSRQTTMALESVVLRRISSGELGTFGVLVVGGYPFCVTLEDPDRNDDGILGNERNQSCIPRGRYRCSRYPSKKFGSTYIVENVTGRDGILFHAGNTHRDTLGCVLLGERFGALADGTPAILESRLAVKRFLERFQEPFDLLIENCY